MLLLVLVLTGFLCRVQSAGILFPRASETRQILTLDGFWNFALGNDTAPKQGWHKLDLKVADDGLNVGAIPVPASYNDLYPDAELRDYVGQVYYQRNVVVPRSWSNQRVWIRFSSVSRGAQVWVNGQLAVSHDFGHLPFQADITSLVNLGTDNVLTVAVDNQLSDTTLPQGTVTELSSGRLTQTYEFDAFNYAGIDCPVVLYTTPTTYIDDITVTTSNDGTNAFVNYSVAVEGSDTVFPSISLVDRSGQGVDSDSLLESSIFVPNANLWWPYLVDPNPGYLYRLEVELLDETGALVDKYILPVGIRTITWDNKSVNINGKPLYLRGVSLNEDSVIKGKGLDLSVITRDFNLIKWLGGNTLRTSHFTFAEEIINFADELGILVIDDTPAYYTDIFSDELLQNHQTALTELIQRDKNHASVFTWVAGNEPRSQNAAAENYFQSIVALIKSLDTSRPVTIVNSVSADSDLAAQFADIVGFITDEGWSGDTADLDLITDYVVEQAQLWNSLHDVPVFLAGYGAASETGLHFLPSYIYSENYQTELSSNFFQAFDQLRGDGYFIGELVYYTDYVTKQDFLLPGGTKRGVFSRNREPKSSAQLLRKRYWGLGNILDNVELPNDLYKYVFSSDGTK